MHYQDNIHSSTKQLDFSSAFMRATSAEQISAMQMSNEDTDRVMISDAGKQQSVRENRNLSSILTHISDDGSTSIRSKKAVHKNREGSFARAATAAGTTPVMQQQTQAAPLRNRQPARSNPYELSAGDEMKPFQNSEKNMQSNQRQTQWLPLALSLALAVTAVMGFNLYQLNDQAKQMQVALSAYEEQVDELSATQNKSSGVLLEVSSMNEELTGLKQQIHAIKSDVAVFDSKLAQNSITSFKSEQQQAQAQEIATVKLNSSERQGSVASSGAEITAIKPEKNKVNSVSVIQKDAVNPSRWAVNLASLSSKEQVKIGLAMLEKSGQVPVVQKVEVNGVPLYRLSVEGFSTRKEAMQFISKAKKQYGFNGGWVRPG